MKILKRARKADGLGGEPHGGWLPPGAASPEPTPVRDLLLEIGSDGEGGYYLLSQAADGGTRADTWHESVDEAIAQAREQFGIRADAWHDVE
jgi:hypothetical protein